MTTPTPIYILTGYLGTGKTTLLKPLLQHFVAQGRKVAVLMNEFGSVSVDTLSLQGSGVPVVDMLDGCVCCTLQGSLEDTLKELITDNQPDVVFLETTGVASPVDLIATLLKPELASTVQLAGVFTLVSARRFPMDVTPSADLDANEKTMIEQVQHADVLMLTKSDMVSAEKNAALEAVLRHLNADAPIFRVVQGNIAPETLFAAKKQEGKAKIPAKPKKLSRDRLGRGMISTRQKATSFGDLTTLYHEFAGTIDSDRLHQLLQTLPPTVVRAKGFYIDSRTHSTHEFQYEPDAPQIMLADKLLLEKKFAIFIGTDLDEVEQRLRELEK